MKLNNLKQDLPETPDFIHQMIVSEVDRQIKKENTGKMVPMRSAKRKHWSFGKAAAVALCATLATSTIVYAGVQLYHIYSEKNGTYGVTTTIEQETDQEIILPDEVPGVEIKANYIPDGMEWIDDKLNYTDQMGGFSFVNLLLDQSDIEVPLEDTDVTETENRTFGKYEGTYIRMNDLGTTNTVSYNQRFYLLCPEEYRVLVVYVSNNVSKEEAYKVIENLDLVENDEMIDTSDIYSHWSYFANPDTEISEDELTDSVSADELTVYHIGESVAVPLMAEDENGAYVDSPDITATVDQVQIADDLSLLNEDRIPDEWKAAVDENGKLVQNELSYIKSGDGVDTLDEVVSTEMENQKLVAVDVTYTNTSDVTLKNILYLASIMTMKQDADTYTIYNFAEEAGDGYDYVNFKSVANIDTMDYYDQHKEYGNGGNYIASLAPGESVTIRIAWIVNERDLPDLYLDLSTYGSGTNFDEHTRLVDIRQN